MGVELAFSGLLPFVAAALIALCPRGSVRAAALSATGAIFVSSLVVAIATAFSSHTLIRVELAGVEFATDGLRAVLACLVALIAFAAIAFARAEQVDSTSTALLLVAQGGVFAAIHAEDSWAVSGGWVLSMAPLLFDPERSVARLARMTTGFIALFTIVGVVGGRFGLVSAHWIGWAWIVSAVARVGAPPFHPWTVAAVSSGRPAATVVTVCSPLAALMLVRGLNLLGADPPLAIVLAVLGGAGAIYAGLIASVQRELGRAIGYVYVSLASGLVGVAGGGTVEASSAVLLSAVSGTLSIAGLMFVAWALKEATDTDDVAKLGGLWRKLPLAAIGFACSALVAIGAPALLAFSWVPSIAADPIHGHGAVLAVYFTTTLQGWVLVRLFRRTFFGAAHAPIAHRLSLVQQTIVGVWAAIFVVCAIVPLPRAAFDGAIRELAVSLPGGRSP